MKNKKTGFTLIELLAVLTILSILSLAVVPMIVNTIEKSKNDTKKRQIDMFAKAIEIATGEYSSLNPDLSDIEYSDIESYMDDNYSNISCDVIEIYEGGNVYVSNCKINNQYVLNKDSTFYSSGYIEE